MPEVKVGVTVFEPEEPAFTEIAPEFESEKSKGCVMVREALAVALGAYPLLKALAFTTALLVKLSVPTYGFADWVGLEPSVV